MSKQQVAPPSQTGELSAEQVEFVFAVMKSEPVGALQKLLTERIDSAGAFDKL